MVPTAEKMAPKSRRQQKKESGDSGAGGGGRAEPKRLTPEEKLKELEKHAERSSVRRKCQIYILSIMLYNQGICLKNGKRDKEAWRSFYLGTGDDSR